MVNIYIFFQVSLVFSKWPFKTNGNFWALGPRFFPRIELSRGRESVLWWWIIAICLIWRPASWNPHTWPERGNSTRPGFSHRATIHICGNFRFPLRGNQLSSNQLRVDTSSLFWFPKWVPSPALTEDRLDFLQHHPHLGWAHRSPCLSWLC